MLIGRSAGSFGSPFIARRAPRPPLWRRISSQQPLDRDQRVHVGGERAVGLDHRRQRAHQARRAGRRQLGGLLAEQRQLGRARRGHHRVAVQAPEQRQDRRQRLLDLLVAGDRGRRVEDARDVGAAARAAAAPRASRSDDDRVPDRVVLGAGGAQRARDRAVGQRGGDGGAARIDRVRCR